MDECLAYFQRAVTDPLSVPPWSEWWAANVGQVERVFPLIEYVRLKHRRLLGARQILQKLGRLPDDFVPPDSMQSGSCSECGERTTRSAGGRVVECPICGLIGSYHAKPAIQ